MSDALPLLPHPDVDQYQKLAKDLKQILMPEMSLIAEVNGEAVAFAITLPDAYIHLDYTDQDIRIYRRANQHYTMSRKAIRYSRASLVEHLQVHRENPLKLELQHLIAAHRRRQAGEKVELNLAEDLTSLAMALEIERMIRDGVPEIAWPKELPWSARSD